MVIALAFYTPKKHSQTILSQTKIIHNYNEKTSQLHFESRYFHDFMNTVRKMNICYDNSKKQRKNLMIEILP